MLSSALLIFTLPALAEAPATVLEHRVDIVVSAAKTLTETVTWQVRIDDPEACRAGLLAPLGLDGASDGAATVLEDLLIVPEGAQPGSTYRLKKSTRLGRGGHSGVMVTAPDLPAQQVVLSVRAPARSPLHVWHDAAGSPEHATRGLRSATITWVDVPSDRPAEAVWSTWEDWAEPGQLIADEVASKLAIKDQLGRDLAGDSTSLSLGEAVHRVANAVALVPGPPGSWHEAQNANDVLDAREGNAVDRAVVLMSLLKVAGFDTAPGQYRRAATGGAFPVTVPAPAMLPHPMIVVRRDGDVVYVDPASELTTVPDLPAEMAGASVWLTGDLPRRMQESSLVDGTVAVNSALTLKDDGSATWQATLSATGPATEWLRQLLAPLDDTHRTLLFEKLAGQARPGLSRFSVDTGGVRNPFKKLKISIAAYEEEALDTVGIGMVGRVPALLGPALAGWLPPHLSIRETTSVRAPPGLQILAVSQPEPAFSDEAIVVRHHQQEGARHTLIAEVERPYRKTTAGRDAAAKRFLEEQAQEGFELLITRSPSPAVAKAIREDPDRSLPETVVLEALLWWSVKDEKRATKVLKKAWPDLPPPEIIRHMLHWLPPGEAELWHAVDGLALENEQPEARMEIAEAMTTHGLKREAWFLAARLQGLHPIPDLQVRSLLLMERMQGAEPDPAADPEGAAIWRDPEILLARASEAARGVNDEGAIADAIQLRLAEHALSEGQHSEAEAMLAEVVQRTDDAAAEALLAHAAALAGVAADEVAARVQSALDAAPYDDRVAAIGAEACAVLTQRARALELGLRAARIAFDHPGRWNRVVDLALDAGDLPTAAYAARRASDAAPQRIDLGYRLSLMATLVGDPEAAAVGRARAPTTTVPATDAALDDLVAATPPEVLLALLAHRDDATVQIAHLLAIRAQLRLERGYLDDAARDGVLLATHHGDPQGWALAFAATAGRLYSSGAVARLDRAETDPTARTTRMEYRLITGAGDATSDARALGEDPRAEQIALLASSPATLAQAVEGWPTELRDPAWTPPRGFRVNRALGAVVGVAAWSDPDGAMAIVRLGGIAGVVPPPLANLYTPAHQPLKTFDHGGQLLRFEGGVLPLYAALAIDGEQEVLGLGFTPEAAERALDLALR